MTLVEFLTARLDEDEAVAREAIRYRDATTVLPGHEPEVPDFAVWANDDVMGGATVSFGPERVLAEVEAKRRLTRRCLAPGRPRRNISGGAVCQQPRPPHPPGAGAFVMRTGAARSAGGVQGVGARLG